MRRAGRGLAAVIRARLAERDGASGAPTGEDLPALDPATVWTRRRLEVAVARLVRENPAGLLQPLAIDRALSGSPEPVLPEAMTDHPVVSPAAPPLAATAGERPAAMVALPPAQGSESVVFISRLIAAAAARKAAAATMADASTDRASTTAPVARLAPPRARGSETAAASIAGSLLVDVPTPVAPPPAIMPTMPETIKNFPEIEPTGRAEATQIDATPMADAVGMIEVAPIADPPTRATAGGAGATRIDATPMADPVGMIEVAPIADPPTRATAGGAGTLMTLPVFGTIEGSGLVWDSPAFRVIDGSLAIFLTPESAAAPVVTEERVVGARILEPVPPPAIVIESEPGIVERKGAPMSTGAAAESVVAPAKPRPEATPAQPADPPPVLPDRATFRRVSTAWERGALLDADLAAPPTWRADAGGRSGRGSVTSRQGREFTPGSGPDGVMPTGGGSFGRREGEITAWDWESLLDPDLAVPATGRGGGGSENRLASRPHGREPPPGIAPAAANAPMRGLDAPPVRTVRVTASVVDPARENRAKIETWTLPPEWDLSEPAAVGGRSGGAARRTRIHLSGWSSACSACALVLGRLSKKALEWYRRWRWVEEDLRID